ncbi:DUF2974 domain-containing protein [Streptococcus ruminantium]|nr:DUF2974 domain-containing protein [Streptococcus ruminantium]
MACQSGNYYLAGHSKGGNLALYAACQLPSKLQESIQAIYSFDAPGLHKKYLETPNYQAIKNRVYPIIPQNSIIGMMLETPENVQVIRSNAVGLLQHISFTWEVEGLDFRSDLSLTEDSLQINQTLKTWTATLSDKELQNFFDLFFGILIQAGIERFSDITVNPLQKLQEIDRLRKALSPEQAEMVDRMIRLLFDTRYQVWRASLGKLLPNSKYILSPQFKQSE